MAACQDTLVVLLLLVLCRVLPCLASRVLPPVSVLRAVLSRVSFRVIYFPWQAGSLCGDRLVP